MRAQKRRQRGAGEEARSSDLSCVAERRLSGSLRLNDVTVLAAADGLSQRTRSQLPGWRPTRALTPDLDCRWQRMLNNCAVVAPTAQRVETDPQSDTETVRSRIENVAAVIRVYVRRWTLGRKSRGNETMGCRERPQPTSSGLMCALAP